MNDVGGPPPIVGPPLSGSPIAIPRSDDDLLSWLSGLPSIEYDRHRENSAKTLGIRVSTLDDIIRQRTSQSNPHYDVDPRPPEYSDESLALRFTAAHPTTIRYIAVWGRWYVWSGKVWAPDDTMLVFNLARELCRRASAEVNDPDVATAVASARTIAAVERLARADPQHAATIDEWDADPWLLNTPGGTIDLRTGITGPHDPRDRITKITSSSSGGDCPLWRKFLAEITDNDLALQLYLQRVIGYSLTGITREHALFFAYGTGGNGKGVFLNTITAILANYAAVASMETFTSSAHDRHSTDLAMLRGARLVTAQETEEGRRWAESRIKAMTGGDPISARFMRQDFFTFIPQFKLLIAGNHKPGLRNVDEAIRRRMNLIPFLIRFAAESRDPLLFEKLKVEWSGILQWAVDGCVLWTERGLLPPEIVTGATDEYLADEDSLQIWIEERCSIDRKSRTGSTLMFTEWKLWAERAGEAPGSQKRFVQNMNGRGFQSVVVGDSKLRALSGISLKSPDVYSDRRFVDD